MPNRLRHEHYLGANAHFELAGQFSADHDTRRGAVSEIYSRNDTLSGQGDWPLLFRYDPDDTHPRGVGCRTQQTRGEQSGTHSLYCMRQLSRVQHLLGRRDQRGREQQLLRAGFLIPFSLDDHMPATEPHAVSDHLFVTAIIQTNGDEQQSKTQPQG